MARVGGFLRAAHAATLVLATMVGAACTDAVGSDAGPVTLLLVPDFGALAPLAAGADQLHVVVTRVIDGTGVADTTVAIDTVTGEATVEVRITLQSGPEDYTVLLQAIRSSDGAVLFEGTDTVTVSPGTTTEVVIMAVAPVALDVTPGFETLGAGATVPLLANLIDAGGAVIGPATATWTSGTPSVASVDASGLVTALAPGTAVIVGTSDALRDSMLVRVAASGSVPVSAIADAEAYRTPPVGDTVIVDVRVNMFFTSNELLGSYNAELRWNPAVIRYVDVRPGDFGTPTINDTQTGTGLFRFSAANANGVAGSVVVARVRFVADAAGDGNPQLTITELSAALSFTNLLSGVVVTNGSVTVRP
jgi:hypothetical protein